MGKEINHKDVFDTLEASRDKLPGLVTKAKIAYPASEKCPEYLEAVHADGRVVVGVWEMVPTIHGSLKYCS
jgi:hypothetical protein